MAELTGEEFFPHDTFHKSWTVFWLLAIGSGIWLWLSFFRPTPITDGPRAAISAGYDWFLVLHMPEVPKDPAKAAASQAMYRGWLDALAKEGYQPMLLSDVEKRLQDGVGLPNRAIVLAFEPAYFHTYDVLAPIFVQYRFPALWVSDHTALLRGDRHFIHQRQAKMMIHSGFWDMAYTGDGFWRKASDANAMVINETRNAEWVPDTGNKALNWATSLPQLNRLNVSSKWTPEELLMRLEMELPLEGTVRLGVRRMLHRLWGVVMTSPQKNSVFTIQPGLGATSANIYWLGTRGVQDYSISVDIPSYFGEVSLGLRSDRKNSEGLAVGFTRHRVFIDQTIQGVRRRLAVAPRTSNTQSIKAKIVLVGSDLSVSLNGAKSLSVSLTSVPPSSQGLVRLQVFDRVRGAARADFVNLSLTSLSQSHLRSSK